MSAELAKLLAVALGGAVGAVCRMQLGSWIALYAGKGFPWGTLGVNVLGAFLIGVLYVVLIERLQVSEVWAALLIIGLLGGFTTYSAFSLDTVMMITHGQMPQAFAYALATLVACLSATAAGLGLTRVVLN